MTPSDFWLYLAAFLFTSVAASLAYLALPYAPRKQQRIVKAWASPATLIAYMSLIIAAFLAAIGQ